MKIGLQTWGSQGDINPFIALAAALVERGHQVSLAITSAHRQSYEHFAAQYGFTLFKVDYIGESEEALEKIGIRLQQSGNNLKQFEIINKEMLEPNISDYYDTAISLCDTHDMIIGHFYLHPVTIAAEKTNTPYISLTLNHGAIPTEQMPPAGMPNLGSWFNKQLWKLTEHLINSLSLPAINQLRHNVNLAPINSYRSVWESKLCNLIAVSPQLCTSKTDWGDNQKICGFIETRHQVSDWQIPDNLQKFLEHPEAPIYITFGSMTSIRIYKDEAIKTAKLLIEAVKIAGCRAIIQLPWDIIEGVEEDSNIYRISSSPYDQIFPKCSAIVHHGGAGTTQTSLLCARPSVVVAHISDQFLFGMELHRLGVAPKLLKRKALKPKALAKAIQTVLNNSTMQQNAEQIGLKLQKENGAMRAVDLIEDKGVR